MAHDNLFFDKSYIGVEENSKVIGVFDRNRLSMRGKVLKLFEFRKGMVLSVERLDYFPIWKLSQFPSTPRRRFTV
jgi:hypothetical protein